MDNVWSLKTYSGNRIAETMPLRKSQDELEAITQAPIILSMDITKFCHIGIPPRSLFFVTRLYFLYLCSIYYNIFHSQTNSLYLIWNQETISCSQHLDHWVYILRRNLWIILNAFLGCSAQKHTDPNVAAEWIIPERAFWGVGNISTVMDIDMHYPAHPRLLGLCDSLFIWPYHAPPLSN